jgi:chemotaxis protein methyltransferase CheR
MLSDKEFGILLDRLNRPWGGYRKVRKGVKKRLRRHMQSIGCSTIEHYPSYFFGTQGARLGFSN